MKTALVITVLIVLLGFSGCSAAERGTGKLFWEAADVTLLESDDILSVNVTAEKVTADNITAATIKITSLPASDPGIPGVIWSDNGTLKVSR